MLIRLPARARAAPQRISARGPSRNIGIRPHCASRVAAAPESMARPTNDWASSGRRPSSSMTWKPSTETFTAWALTTRKPKPTKGATRGSFHRPRGGAPISAGLRLTSPEGSFFQVRNQTPAPSTAKAYIGPARPTKGRTKKGAAAGPSTVPKPWAEAWVASAWVRSCRVVRSAM